jgi:uncharacterized membrane protein YqjE
MADQASVTDGAVAHGSGHGAGAGPDSSVAEFINDLITLAELQAELAVQNGRETGRKAVIPLGLIVFSLAVLTGSVTLCLIGSALLLASSLGIDRGWAMLATAAVASVLASLAGGFGVARLKSSVEPFRSSREELRRNATWLRNVLIRRHHAFSRREK